MSSFDIQLLATALVSVLVLVVLIGAIGYGGWSVLQEVQRVQLAPTEQAPNVVAELDPLANVTVQPKPADPQIAAGAR